MNIYLTNIIIFTIFVGAPMIIGIFLLWRSWKRKKYYQKNPSEWQKLIEIDNLKKQNRIISNSLIQPSKSGNYYKITGIFFGILTFIISYSFCITHYGFLLGLGLGWLPSIIIGLIGAFFWPILIVIILTMFIIIHR